MEIELGLKITRTKDDVSSSTDFKVSRNAFGQLSLSKETDSVFILTLHLKGSSLQTFSSLIDIQSSPIFFKDLRLKRNAGFKKKGIDIKINKEGDRIMISGRKTVEEMVLIKWVEWRKEIEVKEFKKVFRIPEIVNLDKIKARFNEEDGTLTVTFPKKVKGISGLKIEEVEETEEKTEPEEEKTEPEEEIKEETQPEEEEQEVEEPKMEEEEEDKIEEEIMEEEETRDHEEDKEAKERKPKKKRRKKCCFPFVAGSTLLMTIIVLIIQLIQSRRK